MSYICGTARYCGIAVEHDASLKPFYTLAFPFIVDGQRVALDFSDYSIVRKEAFTGEVKHWFMFHHLPVFRPYPQLGAFPSETFHDWKQYYEMCRSPKPPKEKLILHPQVVLSGDSASGFHDRRNKARKMLLAYKSPNNFALDIQDTRPQNEFWDLAMRCRVSVHIPGSTNNMIDRGQHQLFGLGVCTISTDLFCSFGDVRAEPNVHYVCIRDDFSDLLEKVEWCETHPQECERIGKNAQRLFQDNCVPHKIWQYVNRRCWG